MNGGIIQGVGKRIKAIPPPVLVLVSVVLVGVSSFGLGRLSAASERASRVVAVERAFQSEEVPVRNPGGLVVGSRSGSKYHFPWCPGASQMPERNKVWFKDEAEARSRGYTPAGNCKGLK